MAQRLAIVVEGVVQGVGFRPFVHGLASRLGLTGFVLNQSGVVRIEVEGERCVLDSFLKELAVGPPLARIERLAYEARAARGERTFDILPSQAGQDAAVFVSPDVAPCPECLAEMSRRDDRRFGYPFLNCTNCGPRLTVVTGVPYDRQRTTMATFPLCPACQAEYDHPADRRFHAQPTCCPTCGPRLRLLDSRGHEVSGDPLRGFAESLRAGAIGAIKGIGGYHLSCDATRPDVVAELRRRKQRDEKPLAILLADEHAARLLVEMDDAELAVLTSPRRPIVLLRKLPGCGVAGGVAPGNAYLGVMLPSTPLQVLLLRAVGGLPLVMTSGNCSDEPTAHEDSDALRRLATIADLFLTHDRPIHVRCDDSVSRVVDGLELPLRRSRGYAPGPLPLPVACPVPTLAVGGQLKATFALGRGRHAFLSHHLGDLDHYAAYRGFTRDAGLYEHLFALTPELLVCDLHPDYASTRYARSRAEEQHLGCLAVQHHHAHMASCMAENDLREPVIGVVFDGSGYGLDGTVWGGEFLVGDYQSFRRAAHLRPVPMPGGERAVREPWRMALAHSLDAGIEATFRAPAASVATARRLLERGLNSPTTSSIGRLFDAVASLVGLRDRVNYEGQAAVELEALAARGESDGGYPFEVLSGEPLLLDPRPLVRQVVREVACSVEPARIAWRFHATLAAMVVTVCERLRALGSPSVVVLSGGVFQNAILLREAFRRLGEAGFRVYRHRLVPPGDGGLSLGQLAVAAFRRS